MKLKDCKVDMKVTKKGEALKIHTIVCITSEGIIVETDGGLRFEEEARFFRKLKRHEKPGYVNQDTRKIIT